MFVSPACTRKIPSTQSVHTTKMLKVWWTSSIRKNYTFSYRTLMQSNYLRLPVVDYQSSNIVQGFDFHSETCCLLVVVLFTLNDTFLLPNVLYLTH